MGAIGLGITPERIPIILAHMGGAKVIRNEAQGRREINILQAVKDNPGRTGSYVLAKAGYPNDYKALERLIGKGLVIKSIKDRVMILTAR